MLSIKAVKSASHAGHYYDKDNYYAKDSAEAKETSNWYGRGANAMGLMGPVDKDEFMRLLEGKLPNGEQLGRTEDGSVMHRPGYDLTFSAPKSVSILALVGGDKRILEAHKLAVRQTLNHLEKSTAATRMMIGGELKKVNTQNMVIAQFHHDTSRELDPQLHTHNIVLNITLRPDGQWRSLTNEEIYTHKMLGGVMYRSLLATELQKTGYEIEVTGKDGTFEIKGVPQELIKEFSKRREQIEILMEKEGESGTMAAQMAALKTRQAKKEVDRNQLLTNWESQCKEFNLEAFIYSQNHSSKHTQEAAREALSTAIQHLSERESLFHEKDILKESLAFELGKAHVLDVLKHYESAKKNGRLITTSTDKTYTTLAILAEEKEMIRLMQQGKGCVHAISEARASGFMSFIAKKPELDLKKSLSNTELKPGQQAAVNSILSTHDRIVGIQGYAGTGKTRMLSTVRELAEKQGYKLVGISPKASAAKELEQGAHIKSQTLSLFMQQQKKTPNIDKNTLVVMDETSMASTSQMLKLFKIVEQQKSRLVLVGDTQQLAAIGAGSPFAQLQQQGMQVTEMKNILRQKNEKLHEAVLAAIHADIDKEFKAIGDKVVSIDDKSERFNALVNTYFSLSKEERKNTLILTPANFDRTEMNNLIRNGLKETGELRGNAIQTQNLTHKGLSQTEMSQLSSYQIHDVLKLNQSIKGSWLQKREYYQVTEIHQKENQLTLKNEQGKSKTLSADWLKQAKGTFEVFESHRRELMAGDQIRWLKNDYGRDIRNSDHANITRIKGALAYAELGNGKTMQFDLANARNQHWDHAYVSTVHHAQGKTCSNVLIHAESTNPKLTHQKAFYVEISRAQYQATIFTDNKEQLMKMLKHHTGEKFNALESTKTQKGTDNTLVSEGLSQRSQKGIELGL